LVESYLENTLFLINQEFPIHTIADTRINLALEYIHRHYDQEITLEILTEITNLEKNYFIRLFKQYMNLTPYQYIKKYRFNAALSLIKRKFPLSEVALKIGYSDISAFSHAFKRIYGIYPSELSIHEKRAGQ
jgi:AraC-like DNA-binding protein